MAKNKKKSESSTSAGSSGKKHSKRTRSIYRKVVPVYLVFGFILFVSIYLLSPLNRMETLVVKGNDEISEQTIVEASNLEAGNRLWGSYFNRENIEQNVSETIPEISQADLSFSGFKELTLDVTELNTTAFLMTGKDDYVKVLENGELTDTSSSSIGERPILIRFDDEEILNQLIEQLNQLDESTLQLISEIEKMDVKRNPLLIRSYMNDSSQVIASIPTYAERISLYPYLVEAVDGQTGLFDLEAGAYFTPFAAEGSMNGELVPSVPDSSLEEPESSDAEESNEGEAVPDENNSIPAGW